MNTCVVCSKQYEYIKNKGHLATECGTCRTKRSRANLKRKSVELLGGKCVRCGYSKTQKALTFHHLDPTTKSFDIGGYKILSWPKLQEELKKCELLCLNCHQEVHDLP